MRITKLDQQGSHALAVVLIIAVVLVVGAVGYMVFNKSKTRGGGSNSNGQVTWSFNGNAWQASGQAPTCEQPLAIDSPVDVTKVNAILYPGQIRGGDFKPHGGLGIEGATTNDLEVRTVRNAYLYRGSRYIEQGETQYLFDFIDSCGVMFRFDHLLTLSPEFQKYADKLPAAQPDMSQTTVFNDYPDIKAGTLVGTKVGFTKNQNVFFDFGVYDLRQANAASKTDLYQTDQQRIQDKEQSFYALCWIDLLQGEAKSTVQALKPRNSAEATSDYCNITP